MKIQNFHVRRARGEGIGFIIYMRCGILKRRTVRKGAEATENAICMFSPFGALTLTEENERVAGVTFGAREGANQRETPLLREAVRQLALYFEGRLKRFDLPLALKGTPFQRDVWQAIFDIPYGETRSYGEIARAVGRESARRAVGMASHRNPVPIIVPCHRVIGANGSLTGYGGGLEVKRSLLTLEGIGNWDEA